jgi:hypothetical protein
VLSGKEHPVNHDINWQIQGLIEQIARDTAVLKGSATYHQPSREFYEERIAAYRQTVIELREQAGKE